MRAYKQPAATQFFVYDFSDDLGDATIIALVPGTPESTPRGDGENLTIAGQAITESTVLVKWAGGVDGETYLTTVRVTDTAGEVHEREGEIVVRETSFTVPLGIATRYLTVEDYVDRFGAQETVRLTDEARSGTIDGPKLEQAIRDAADLADSYLGTRYPIPLENAPRIIGSIVAALTREALHKTRPTPEVKDAADRARAQLRDLSAGRMTIPVEVGETAPQSSLDQSSMRSGEANDLLFNRPSLDNYVGIAAGAYEGGRWRTGR